MAYAIYHRRLGTFLGLLQGSPVWSKVFACGADAAAVFPTRWAAQHVAKQVIPKSRSHTYPQVEPDIGEHVASMYACVRAGMDAWLADIPGVAASPSIWEQFVRLGSLECPKWDRRQLLGSS